MASVNIVSVEKLGLVDSGLLDRKTGRKVLVPEHSKFIHDGRRIVRIVASSQTIASNMANSTNETRFVWDGSTVDSCKMLLVRFRVSVSGSSSRLVPTPYWFSRIEMHYRGSGSTYCQRWYPETLMAALGLRPPSDIFSLAKSLDINPDNMWAGKTHGVGVSKYYHLWLPCFWETGLHLDGKEDLGGTQMELRFVGNGGIVASGGGTVSVDNMDLLIDSDIALEQDKKAHRSIISSHVQACVFVDPVQVIGSNQTWNAATTYDIPLESYSGKCAGFLLAVGSNIATTGQAASYGNLNYVSLDGSGAGAGTIDIVSASGEALTTGGSPFEVGFNRQWLGTKWFNQQFLRNHSIYPIIFARDLQATVFHGQVDDYFRADGSQYRMRVTTPAAGTNEVQTVTQSGTPASGTYKLGWSDPTTGLTSWTADLAYNTSAANMKVAFEALESVVQGKILVTFSAAASAGAAYTATFTNFAGQASDLTGNLIQVISQTATSAPANVGINSIARTTIGVPGWLNGVYTYVVYGLMIKRATKGGGAYLSIADL